MSLHLKHPQQVLLNSKQLSHGKMCGKTSSLSFHKCSQSRAEKRGSERSFNIKRFFHPITSCLNSRTSTLCWHSGCFFVFFEKCLGKQSSRSRKSLQCKNVCSSLYYKTWWLFSCWQALSWNHCALNLHLALVSWCVLRGVILHLQLWMWILLEFYRKSELIHCSAPLAEGKCAVEALRSLEKRLWLFCWCSFFF